MGQLTNLYVSQSYQGLLKMTDSSQGLTNTLQTIQTGDGDNSPLQMSFTEVNISGSLTVNGAPIEFTNTGAFATTGSNTFIGNQTVTGSVNITGQYLVNGVPFAGGSNGTSGTSGSNGSSGTSGSNGSSGTSGSNGSSGTSGTRGSSGTSGTSGQAGSSGTSGSNGSSGTSGSDGTSGSNGSDGTSGTSGSSGTDGLGLPAKVISTVASNFTYVDYTSINTGLSGSTQVVTFAQPFSSSDYSIDLLWEITNSGYYDGYYSNGSPVTDVTFSGKTVSGFTAILWNIDLSLSPYSGMTGYYSCIATGSSNGSGLDGSSGTSGSSGTQGTSGSSGTSGQNGISAGRTYYFNQSETSDVAGYKVLSEIPTTGTTQTVTKTLTNTQQNVLVESYITPQLGFSLIPAGVQRFHLHLLKPASNDDIDVYVTLQLANSTGGTIGSLITSSANIITWNSGNPAEVYVDVVFTSTPIDPTNRFIVKIYLNNNDSTTHNVTYYTEGTEYSYVITSVGVVAGSSGTSGTSGAAGSSGTSGTSAAGGDRNGLITTGSVALQQSITGSLNISEGLIDTGSITNVGDVYIFNPASNNSAVKLNISGSNSATGSNLIFGGPGIVTTQSGSVVITGSNNILLNGFRNNTLPAGGTYGYIGGNTNVVTTIPTLNTGSLVRPTMTSNQLNSALNLAFVTSSVLAVPSLTNNQIFGITNLNHQSGSIALAGNYVMGQGLTSNATGTTLSQIPQVSVNLFAGIAFPHATLNHNSSSINYQGNIGGGLTVTNNYTSSVSNAINNINVTGNLLIGSGHSLVVTGSNSGQRRQFNYNTVLGVSNIINSTQSGSNQHLVATAVLGENLIVSASNTSSTTGGGTVIVGRNNATGSLQESSQDTVFVVGTGTSAAARRNALRIDSNNNSNFTGSVNISGSLALNGSVLGSLQVSGNTSITGSLNVSSNINNLKIHTGSANVDSIGIGANTLDSLSGSSLANIAIGNSALRFNITGSNIVAIGNGALGNSLDGFNTAIGASGLGSLVYGSQNMAIGQSAIQALVTGSKNTAIGFNTMVNVLSGSNNTAIGAGTLQRNISGSNCVVIGNQAGSWSTSDNEFFIGNDNYGNADLERSGSMFYGVFASPVTNQTLQINAKTTVKNNLTVSGSLAVTGSVYITGSVQGNVSALSISSNTASLNLATGNFFTLQLVSGSSTHINPTNISQGQTVNILLNTTGSATVSFPSSVKQAVGFTYVPTTTTSKDIITLVSFDNSALYLANVKNLA